MNKMSQLVAASSIALMLASISAMPVSAIAEPIRDNPCNALIPEFDKNPDSTMTASSATPRLDGDGRLEVVVSCTVWAAGEVSGVAVQECNYLLLEDEYTMTHCATAYAHHSAASCDTSGYDPDNACTNLDYCGPTENSNLVCLHIGMGGGGEGGLESGQAHPVSLPCTFPAGDSCGTGFDHYHWHEPNESYCHVAETTAVSHGVGGPVKAIARDCFDL